MMKIFHTILHQTHSSLSAEVYHINHFSSHHYNHSPTVVHVIYSVVKKRHPFLLLQYLLLQWSNFHNFSKTYTNNPKSLVKTRMWPHVTYVSSWATMSLMSSLKPVSLDGILATRCLNVDNGDRQHEILSASNLSKTFTFVPRSVHSKNFANIYPYLFE